MNLVAYLHTYLAERPGLSVGYGKLLAATVRHFCAYLGRDPPLAEIDRTMVAGWVTACLARGQRPSTVNAQARRIRGLLLAAYDDGLLDRPPRRLRRLAECLPPPEAWTVEECRVLLAHLTSLTGRVGSRPASDWFYSLVLTIYWTGARISALLRSTVEDYTPGEGLVVHESKTGKSKYHPLPASCCEAIERVLPESGPIWPWPMHKRSLWNHFRRYVEAAGLPAPRTHTQLFYRLRRTNASYCALVDPAIAQRQLDHASLATTTRHYLDPRIVRQQSAADVLPDPTPQRPRLRVVG